MRFPVNFSLRNHGVLLITAALVALFVLNACAMGKNPTTPANTATNQNANTGNANPFNLPIPTTAGTNPSFAYIQQNILIPKCQMCHTQNNQQGNYNVDTYDTATVAADVTAGKPLTSELYVAVALGEMPQGGALLSAPELANIYTWIANGAQDN